MCGFDDFCNRETVHGRLAVDVDGWDGVRGCSVVRRNRERFEELGDVWVFDPLGGVWKVFEVEKYAA